MIKDQLIFERSVSGHRAAHLPSTGDNSRPMTDYIPADLLRQKPAALPELAEIDVVRHFTRLSQLNFSIDTHFYPLGSCTMKYNPKINDKVAALPGFANIHPRQPTESVQGMLDVLAELEAMFCEICGMDAFTLQPAAGAHGELTGMLMVHAYHKAQGRQRKKVIVADSSHGTNPSSAHICGYDVVTVPSAKSGEVDLAAFERALDADVAAVMLTNPSTHGLFESRIKDMADLAHKHGALLYYDGANLNALCGLARPGDMGFDVVHINTHNTFSTPHGGGGPGSGPVGVKSILEPFLPVPRLRKTANNALAWDDHRPHSIGRVRSFYGNIGVLLRAYTYIRAHGAEGLTRNSRAAIINANYIKEKLKQDYPSAFDHPCMHECILMATQYKTQGILPRDIAKRLLDFGFHAPTIEWPVRGALMIEPTETESRKTLDRFIEVMRQIANEIRTEPQTVANAPHTMPVQRLDEVKAARQLDVCWCGPR
jgi:glycine dehydrogenase subunit 2